MVQDGKLFDYRRIMCYCVITISCICVYVQWKGTQERQVRNIGFLVEDEFYRNLKIHVAKLDKGIKGYIMELIIRDMKKAEKKEQAQKQYLSY